MYLYNVGIGMWQYSYSSHFTSSAEVSTSETVLHGQKVSEIRYADGLCLVLSSYCTVSPMKDYCPARITNRRKLLGFPSFSMKG